jgi:hypothetical protein
VALKWPGGPQLGGNALRASQTFPGEKRQGRPFQRANYDTRLVEPVAFRVSVLRWGGGGCQWLFVAICP